MNQFKEDINRELRSILLSDEKKRLIAMKSKARVHRQRRRTNWQYRFVIVTFMIFALGSSYLFWQEGNPVDQSVGAAPPEPVTPTTWALLDHDFSKSILLISFFIVLRLVIKRRLEKGGKELPVCVTCGEEWSFQEALKRSMKNREMTCPHCGQTQYRTRKSAGKAGLLNMFIPFIAIVPMLFDHVLLGFVVYASCVGYFVTSLSPYFVDLQEKDPFNDPLW